MTVERSMERIAAGVLLGTFVGDALGARWEGAGAVDLAGAQRRLELSATATTLTYTDDTQLTLALAEHLCVAPAVEPAGLAATFLEHFEGHRGYARGMFGIVDAWERGVEAADAARSVFPDGSFGNGAAMRAAPVGVVWHDDPVAADAAARAQAVLTHAHPIGADGAAAQARAVTTAAVGGGFATEDIAALVTTARTPELTAALTVAAEAAEAYLAGRNTDLPRIAEVVGTGVLADQSVPAALWVAAVAQTYEEAVVLSLGLGGDVDTIAAMACAVLGAAVTDTPIPAQWLDLLEDGPRGRSYAEDLARRLGAAASAPR